METHLEQESATAMRNSGSSGLLCTGPNGMLLHSIGDAPSDRAAFLSSLMSKAESLHQEKSVPIVSIETTTR